MSNADPQSAATGISYGALPRPEHARQAVLQAMQGLQGNPVGSVLLFLTEGYSHSPQAALKLAAATAGTPQVFGCCAAALLNQDDWVLDGEGAVALVLPQAYSLQPLQVSRQQGHEPRILLTLTSPNAATIAVNASDLPQFGVVCSDQYGQGPYSVWQSGRIVEREYAQLAFAGDLQCQIGVAEGVKRVSPMMLVNRAKDHTLWEIDQISAMQSLHMHTPENLLDMGVSRAHNLLCAVSENNSLESIEGGHFRLLHVVAVDRHKQQVHLSGSVRAGRYVFWALRDEQRAQEMMRLRLEEARKKLSSAPKFALMFPNVGRGTEFYNGEERDLQIFKEVFPNTPMVGMYGNAEIAPGHQLPALIQHYSTVFALFA